MQKYHLIWLNIFFSCLIILVSFSNSMNVQSDASSNQETERQTRNNTIFQTITEHFSHPSLPEITGDPPNFYETINTSVDEIIPYEQTESPLNVTATGPSDLSNVTLYYRYGTDDSSRLYATEITQTDVSNSNLNYPNAITSINGIGFIASYLTNSLVVYNVTNSSNIQFVSSTNDGIYTYRAESTEATSDGKYVYLLTRNRASSYVSMYNATDLLSLSRMASDHLNSSCQGGWLEMDTEENYLYVGADYYIKIYNITDKTGSQSQNKSGGQLDYVGCISFVDILPKGVIWKHHVVGDTLYVPCGYHNNNSTDYKGLRIYDINDRENPVYVNSLNWSTTYGWDCQIFTHSNGFDYLIFGGISQLIPYRRAKVNVYNISAGNATHPKFMYTINSLDSGGNCSNSFGVVYNDYLFMRNENLNHTSNPNWNTGFWVYNLTDINTPTVLTRLYGDGAPTYLETLHYIEGDKNGSDRSIFMLSMNDDALVVIDPTWETTYPNLSSWVQFDSPDSSYPWSWDFDFPDGDGYYEFYSIGQKSGLPAEEPPLTKDANVHFTGLNVQVDFIYTPDYPTIHDIVLFSDTSIIPNEWVINWKWDFGDGNSSTEQNPMHQYANEGIYSVTLVINDDQGVIGNTTKTLEVKPLGLHTRVIIGKITEVTMDDIYISFKAANIFFFSFSPINMKRYNSGEIILITKDYFGFLGEKWGFILCHGALIIG